MSEDGGNGCGCCGFGPFGLIGTVLAVLLSWEHWHSIPWAIVHAILSWIYVVYHGLQYGRWLP